MTACYLSFDYGSKKIGVAVGQGVTATATPLKILPLRGHKPDWDSLGKLLQTWRPTALVVGLPLRADGSDSASTKAARRFMRQLEGRYGLPVHAVNEYLSSCEARGRLKRGTDLDAAAAQIILETWLAEQ